MKKIYVNPSIEVVNIQIQHVLAGGSENYEINNDPSKKVDPISGADSRRGFWDDDEEEY